MKTKEIDTLTQALAPILRDFVAQQIEPVLLRVRGVAIQCEQLKTRLTLLESKAVPPSTPEALPAIKSRAPLPVVRLGGPARHRRVVRL